MADSSTPGSPSGPLPPELEALGAAIGRVGLTARPTADGDALEVLLSGDDPEDARRPMTIHSMQSEDTPDDGVRMLAFRSSYPFAAAPDAVAEVRRAGAELLPYLLLGHVEVDDDGAPHLSYAMLADAAVPLSDGVVRSLLSLLDYEQQHFGDYLESLCSGRIPGEVFADFVARGEESGLD